MPWTKSAKKALRQASKRRDRNRDTKKNIKTQTKKFVVTLKDGTAEQRTAEFKLAVKRIDKAMAKGILHRNTAARKKSLLARQLNKATAPKPTAPTA